VQGLNAAAVATICSAENVQSDGTLALDSTGLNYGISCAPVASVPLTGSAVNFTLQVTIPAGLNAANAPSHDHGKPILLYAFLLGLPAMVFVGTGTFAFGSQRQRLLLRRLTSGAALLLILTLLVLLPACSGGFKANFGGTTTASYQLTVMGYVADGTNTVQGAEVFTVPLTILH
jgi:4-amino-4-deoxy-L-arabinose transferase-like glycosyltransferase